MSTKEEREEALLKGNDVNLGFKEHLNEDFHLIGDALPSPVKVSSGGNVGILGVSPRVAREDHVHENKSIINVRTLTGAGSPGYLDIAAGIAQNLIAGFTYTFIKNHNYLISTFVRAAGSVPGNAVQLVTTLKFTGVFIADSHSAVPFNYGQLWFPYIHTQPNTTTETINVETFNNTGGGVTARLFTGGGSQVYIEDKGLA
jgi:hypothetical protein